MNDLAKLDGCGKLDRESKEIRFPVLFNTWKHHAAALRRRIAACGDAADLTALAKRLVVTGSELMDLYTGELGPGTIADKVITSLQEGGRLALESYRPWVTEAGGYRTVTFSEDESQWVLRLGDPADRYIHVHPGRWTPHTRRVRANVLKTAVMVMAHTRIYGSDPLDVKNVNAVRQSYLALSPVRSVEGDQGLGAVLALLAARPDRAATKNK